MTEEQAPIDPQKHPPLDYLRTVLDYDPLSGAFTWLVSLSPRGVAGSLAWNVCCYGYLVIRIQRKAHKAHRLAWLYVHGSMPTQHIDHINGDRDDNMISNLRDVSRSVNAQNIRHARGTIFDKRTGRWYAQLTTNGIKKHIGSFSDEPSAHAAYLSAKRATHHGCTI